MNKQSTLQTLPGVDTLIVHLEITPLIELYGRKIVTQIVRTILDQERTNIINDNVPNSLEMLISEITTMIKQVTLPSLQPVINATGIVLHTNLGRAPLGNDLIKELAASCGFYSNLEFNTKTGKRGERNIHVETLLKTLTNSEAAMVVNNNASSLILTLNALANKKEVIVSRGELIEIGGSFRLPEIMEASGAIMVEVGTTNRTRAKDYENAITDNTALILKVHKSNFFTTGFTEEATTKELAELAHKHNLPMAYDLGSGLLDKINGLELGDEPSVKSSLKAGADIIMFSCDKILSGPQAGAIIGRKRLLDIIAKSPLRRALRVGKLTLAALSFTLRQWMSPNTIKNIPSIKMMQQTQEELKLSAENLQKELTKKNIPCNIIKSSGQYGGGSIPHMKLNSFAIQINFNDDTKAKRVAMAEKMFKQLLKEQPPILGILRQGEFLLDVLTIQKEDHKTITNYIEKHFCPNTPQETDS